MNYATVNDYGIIGNHYSSALVSRLGSIDWCCLPFLDSPSHFGALIDPQRGGRFQILPLGEFTSEQHYHSRTQALETFFETPTGKATLTDWMPIHDQSLEGPTICRKLKVVEGQITWLLSCTPRFQYGTDASQLEKHPWGILFRGSRPDDLALLQSEVALDIQNSNSATGKFSLDAGQTLQFVWSWGRQFRPYYPELNQTLDYWRKTAHHCKSSPCEWSGPWHDLVTRSSLLLKLMMTVYSGAPAETVATRSWSPACASIREGAFLIQALTALGYTDEAHLYFAWLKEIIERDGPQSLQAVYTLDGGRFLADRERGVTFHLDIYGQLILAVSEYYRLFQIFPDELWPRLSEIADYVCQAWKRPDYGLWGNPTRPEHFVSSKLFCWAALDQMNFLAKSLKKRPVARWIAEQATLHRTICEQGFDPTQNTFVRAFGDRDIDTSVLWIPMLHFLPPDDYRVQGTLNAIQMQLSHGILLKRTRTPYLLQGQEDLMDLWSTLQFICCLVLSNRIDEAVDRLAEFCTYANPLGLFGEHLDLVHERVPRFFPSTSVHLLLINAALYIGSARGKQLASRPLIGSPKYSLNLKEAA